MFVFGAGAFGRLGLGNNEDVMYYQPKLCPASLKLKVDKVPPTSP
jgi:alpha-tubulin suppressor-like RCC1 family protein